jgi:hypothetical protein
VLGVGAEHTRPPRGLNSLFKGAYPVYLVLGTDGAANAWMQERKTLIVTKQGMPDP